MLTLYHAPTSVCSQKVRVGLALMGLEWEGRLLDLQRGDQFAPEYRALNPDAVVPTLVDDGLVVVESSLILEYLDAEYNGGRLMPAGRAARVAARHWLLRCLHIHAAVNTLSFSTAYRDRFLASHGPEDAAALARRFPDPIMGAKRRDLLEKGIESAYLDQAFLHLGRCIDDMQAQLSGPWLGGEAPGIADVALVAYIDRIDRLGFAGFWADRPAIAPWLARWRETPAYAEGIEAFIPPGSADQTRAAGARYWPALAARWAAFRAG